MKDELERRESNAGAIEALLRGRLGQWVDVYELANVGGFAAWRTRVSDVRAKLSAEYDLVWNGDVKHSAYMLRPKALGRDAAEHLTQKSLFG